MWIPASEDELVWAVNAAGGLVETDTFDAKADLPKKSMDLATDVAAMATAGGVLCYGVAEDANGQATVLAAVKLDGARERIDQIVQAGIAEAPYIEIRQIATLADPTRGYVLVLVPASPRAPHMVTVSGDNRFYRRSGTRNVPMNENEVATVYERRQQWMLEAASSLSTEINQPLLQPTEGSISAQLVARPVISDSTLLQRAAGSAPALMVLTKALEDALNWTPPSSLVVQDGDAAEVGFRQFTEPVTWKRTPTGWIARDIQKRSMTGQVALSARDDGSIHLFAGRIGDFANEIRGGRLFVYADFLVAYGARFARFLGLLYERCQYVGPVNAGIRLTGLLGAVHYRPRELFFGDEGRYEEPEYRRTTRLPASQLMNDPKALGRDLISPFLQTLTQGRFDPFAGTEP